MNNVAEQDLLIKNVNSPFTEIFSKLTKYEILPDNTLALAYSPEDLKAMRDHANNAVDVMLQGLQDIGQLLAVIDKNKMREIPLESVGCFVSATCNLVEAMRMLINL